MKLSCYIVLDLLASYKKGSISEKSREDIQMHLGKCKECRSAYDLPNSETAGSHITENKIYISKALIGLIIGLFVFFQFAMDYQGRSPLLQYEAELYILIISAVPWFLCKDLNVVKQKQDQLSAIMHILIFTVSIISLVMLYLLLTTTINPQSVFMHGAENKVTIYYSAVFLSGMACAFAAGYGLYASIVKSKNYCSLVSHGMGSAVMLYSILKFIGSLSLRMPDTQIMSVLIDYNILFPYAEGVVLTLIYFAYSNHVRSKPK